MAEHRCWPPRRLQPPQPEVAVIEHHCWPLCRLQPPKPEDRPAAQFKPGTSTWNTDDPSQAPPWVRAQVQPPLRQRCL